MKQEAYVLAWADGTIAIEPGEGDRVAVTFQSLGLASRERRGALFGSRASPPSLLTCNRAKVAEILFCAA
jgi:hypothetical protein